MNKGFWKKKNHTQNWANFGPRPRLRGCQPAPRSRPKGQPSSAPRPSPWAKPVRPPHDTGSVGAEVEHGHRALGQCDHRRPYGGQGFARRAVQASTSQGGRARQGGDGGDSLRWRRDGGVVEGSDMTTFTGGEGHAAIDGGRW
jgi:hypothetical protein